MTLGKKGTKLAITALDKFFHEHLGGNDDIGLRYFMIEYVRHALGQDESWTKDEAAFESQLSAIEQGYRFACIEFGTVMKGKGAVRISEVRRMLSALKKYRRGRALAPEREELYAEIDKRLAENRASSKGRKKSEVVRSVVRDLNNREKNIGDEGVDANALRKAYDKFKKGHSHKK